MKVKSKFKSKFISSIILFSGSTIVVAIAALINLSITPLSVAQTGTQSNPLTRQGLVGQVNVATPIQIKFINKTPVILAIDTPGSETYNMDPSDSISSTLPQLPAYFFIQSAQQDMSLHYEVTVQDNQVSVQIQQANQDTPSDGALKVNRAGYIYAY